MDYAGNTKKEDQIIITGLTSKTPMLHQPEEKKPGLEVLLKRSLIKLLRIPQTILL
jgi:hypothetical protein